MENKVQAICQECGKQFEYNLKPGYPRKYCFVCAAKKKQAYEDMQIPVVKPGQVSKETGQVITEYGNRIANLGIKPGEAKKEAPVVPNGQLSMYVSYAKDIFLCSSIQESLRNNKTNVVDAMKIATDLVKQAQKDLS